jgi:hypothetical protein
VLRTNQQKKRKTEAARVEAEKAGEEASKADDVVEIDAKAEAAKEASS